MRATIKEMRALDDLIAENNRLIIEEYGGNPPEQLEEKIELTRKYIKAIKEARKRGVELSYDDLEKMNEST